MKYLNLLALLWIFLLGCSQPEQSVDPLAESIDSLFNTATDFSGVVLVAENGKGVYHRAFGFRNVNTGSPNDTTSIFELASVSKQFTAMAIMMLQEEGKLSFDDPLEKYVPNLPYKGITIRHLLNHTSGLPDYQDVMDKNWDKTRIAGNSDNIEYLIRFAPPSRFSPGSKYEYSNTGYMLLGSVVEVASGVDFVSFCKTRIFVPLKMTSTGIRTLDEKVQLENMAWGHIYVPEKHGYVRADSFPSNNYTIWLGNRVGPGRVSSTASDLLKWDRALYTEKLVKTSIRNEAFSPAVLTDDSISNYGFGWTLETNSVLGKTTRHDGDNPGYSTHIVRFIEKDKTIVMLCNNHHAKFDELLDGLIHVLMKSEKVDG
jgi:CubicO group peptidase (beta-lactamase class C family)